MNNYPKVKSVKAIPQRRLLVTFSNDIKKIYDCSMLLGDENFKPLQNDALFKSVKADKHGYGISWNDEIDLSESELWINGVSAEHSA